MKRLFSISLVAAAAFATAVQAETVPWEYKFDREPPQGLFTIIDANDDGKTWEYRDRYPAMVVDYNDEIETDDWLITPGFEMVAGRTYKFSLDACAAFGAERFEVFAGTAATAEAMTLPVIERTSITSDKYATFTGEFTAPVSGTVYIGVHGCSAPDKLMLRVRNFKLVSGVSSQSPAQVENFTVTPDPTADLKVDISYRLPSRDASGAALTSISKTEIYVDGNLLVSLPGTPGQDISYTHSNAPAGDHTYMALAYSGNERGAEAESTVFVGAKQPGEVTGLRAVETEEGLVTISWETPRDIDGKPLNPERVTYKVVQSVPFQGSYFTEEDIEGADNIAQTSFTHRALEAGADQKYTSYGVYAITSGGRSKAVKLPLFPVGRPEKAPYKESFADGKYASLMRSETVRYSQVATFWDPYTDEAGIGITSQDADNGFLVMAGLSPDDCARIYTGKIDLSGITAPELSFYVYNTDVAPDANTLEVYAALPGGSYNFVKEVTIGECGPDGWCRVSAPLTAYAGKTVQIALQGTIGNISIMAIDNLRVAAARDIDMAVEKVTAPADVVAGCDYRVKVRVAAHGVKSADSADVDLFRDGKVVASKSCDIAAGTADDVVFDLKADVFTVGEVEFSAAVRAKGDSNAENDTPAAAATVRFVEPRVPAPSALSASMQEKSVELKWSAPDLSQLLPDAITDDFESYDAFAKSFGDWTVVDADGNQNGKFSDITFPGINDKVEGGQADAFWILDSNASGLNSSFASFSGSKCMAQIFCYGGMPSDDWAISPELAGCKQQISFMAKSYSSYTNEDLEVLYSTAGTDISDFVSLATEQPANMWTEYSYTLPEGARYFAIRCTSTDKYMLLIDDVTYIPAQGTSTATLVGYNVYRDREKINESPVAAPEYSDTEAPAGMRSYSVTALFSNGESLACEPVELMVSYSSVGEVNSGIALRGLRGAIEIDGAEGREVEVFAADGRLVASLHGSGHMNIQLPAGIYVVRIGAASAKVVVR